MSYGNDLNVLTYVQSLPLGERTETRGSLVILIDEQQIRELLDQIEWVHNGTMFILNRHKEVVMATADRKDVLEALKPWLTDEQGHLSYTSEAGEEMEVTYTSSAQNGWTYVSVVPRDIVLQRVNMLKTWALFLVLACLAGGAMASYFMAYKNYRPIREVVHAIRQRKSVARDAFSNEYDLIKQSILQSFQEEKQLKRTISRQAPVIQADFVSRLIRGHVDVSAVTEEDLEFMGVRFRHERFCLILLDIDDGSRFMKEDSEKEWALMRFILVNLGSELLGEDGYIVEMELDRLAVLVNLNETTARQSNVLQHFIRTIREMLEKRFKTKVTLAVSRVHRGIRSIAECYGEAVMAMDYKMMIGQHSVIYYDELNQTELRSYHYPMETEMQLINYVKSGDYARSETILNQIYEVNFHERGLTPEMGKSLFFELVGTLLKLSGSLKNGERAKPAEDTDPFKILANGRTAEEMFVEVKAFYRKLCEQFEQDRTRHGEQLFQRMLEFLNRHCCDSNFSMTTLADHFGMNASYLSTFFKKHSGENVSDYIARMRIAECKKLLADPSLTISEIAEKVGYAGSVGLIRVFKKLEGITPGQYRSNLEKTGRSQ